MVHKRTFSCSSQEEVMEPGIPEQHAPHMVHSKRSPPASFTHAGGCSISGSSHKVFAAGPWPVAGECGENRPVL
jgi:hypothetical protein